MKIFISLILDLLFFLFSSFFLLVIWLRYFLSSTVLIIFLSVIISIILSAVFIAIRYIKHTKTTLNKKHEQEFLNYTSFFMTSSSNDITTFLSKVFTLKRNTINLKKLFNTYNLTLVKNYFICESNSCLLCFNFNAFNLNDTLIKETLSKIENKNYSNIYLLCNNLDDSGKKYVELLKNVKIITLKEFYNNILKDENYIQLENTSKKLTFKQKFTNLITILFNENQTKSYFLCAFTLVLGSLIVRYNIYYIIFASVLILFSIICKLISKHKRV